MNSPYLKDPNRLADVIAAIQAMATYKFYKLDFKKWADRISADPGRAHHWQTVFEEHPEFFRLDGEKKKASLVWRRQHPKRFSVDTFKELSKEECDLLTPVQWGRVSRVPLPASDIKTLIDTATNLHSRAIEAQQHQHWYRPLMLQAAAGLLGALIGAWASSQSKPVIPITAASAAQIQQPVSPK